MKTVNTGVPSPAPNHSIASTSQAIGGVPSSTVTSGRAIIDAVIETPAASPSSAAGADRQRQSGQRAARGDGEFRPDAVPASMSPTRVAKVVAGSGRISGP
jgi:hypothetical protein